MCICKNHVEGGAVEVGAFNLMGVPIVELNEALCYCVKITE